MTDLEGFTEEQLRAELERRRLHEAGKDWYYIPDKYEAGGEELDVFLLVHKQYWHLHHALYAGDVHGLVQLPRGFAEGTDSTFEYDGSVEEGERLLQQSGFAKLEYGWPCTDSLVSYSPLLRQGGPLILITADTPDIKRTTEEWMRETWPSPSDKLPADWEKEVYMGAIDHLAQQHRLAILNLEDSGYRRGDWLLNRMNYHADVQRSVGEKVPTLNEASIREKVWMGASMALLDEELYKSLPEFKPQEE